LDTKITIEYWRIKSNNNIFDNDKWNIGFVQNFMLKFLDPFNFLSNEKMIIFFFILTNLFYFWNLFKLRKKKQEFENEQDKHEWDEHSSTHI